jgi:hypothetical protein
MLFIQVKIFSGDSPDEFLKEMDLRLLGELPILRSIADLSYHNCGIIDENLELIFKPIVNNIVNKLRGLKKVI